MAGELILATQRGVVVCEKDGSGWQVLRRGLIGERATSVIAREGVILAGTWNGVFRSDDLGLTWLPASENLNDLHVRWLAFHPEISDFELAGTEPAGIYCSRDGAASWQDHPGLAELRRSNGWYLPYSPQAGCVRGFAVNGARLYAAVEVGGVLRSDDYGQNWALVNGQSAPVNHDVHSICIHPDDAQRVYTPTGGGFYSSPDGGQSWQALVDHCYCRAMWLDPGYPERILLGVADGVDRNGRIDFSEDGGQTWQPASGGLQAPWKHHMVERFTQVDERVLAVLSNGELLQAEIGAPARSWSWSPILADVPGIQAVTQML